MEHRKSRTHIEQWNEQIIRFYPGSKMPMTITFQVTDACNLACTYCYQTHKGTRKMPFSVAKEFIDNLFAHKYDNYIDPSMPGIILEFIGGEPLLEFELIDRIIEYFRSKAISLHHKWAACYCVSMCSNGTLYFEPGVREFLLKHRNHMSFSITIDGNKELHDSCRVFHDGSPSYDIAMAAVKDWMSTGADMGSKITLSPYNIEHAYKAITHMYEEGYTEIFSNCVFEEGWTPEHATKLYYIMKQLADYILEHGYEYSHTLSLFEENSFKPMPETENQNWCFKEGTLVLAEHGNIPIQDCQDKKVYTIDGKLHEVENLLKKNTCNPAIIKASGMFETYTTCDHPYLAKKFLYQGNSKRQFAAPKYIPVSELFPGDKIALSYIPPGNVHINPHVAYVVGRYIGDGWHSTTGYKICSNHNEIQEVIEKLDIANIQYSHVKYRTIEQFNIFKSNIELLSILKNAGNKAINKHIPPEAFQWDKECRKELLHGLFDADSCIQHDKNGIEIMKFNTISYTLANDVLTLLRGLHYFPICSINKRAGKSYIENREVTIHDRYEIIFYTDKRSRYMEHDKEYNVIWTRVSEIDTDIEPYPVYNLTVKDDHSFIANGAYVHNCGGDGKMLSIDADGDLYPCIRYMRSSLGDTQEPLKIGSVKDGIGAKECDKNCLACLKGITRRSQSTDECFYCPIAQGCAWCFPAGTKISTPNGLVNIEDIKDGDYVLDMNGDTQKVINNFKHNASNLVYVKAAGLSDLLVTEEHPFYAKPVKKKIRNMPVYDNPQWVKAKDLKATDKIALYVPKLGNKEIDKEIAYLLGRYIGDGYKIPSYRKAHPYRYYITCAFNQDKKLEEHICNANVSFSKDKQRTVYAYNINITNNEFLISLLDQCGRYAKDKHVPRDIWTWDRESVKAMLQGYFDADGCYRGNTQRFSSISYELILNISELVRAVYHTNVSISAYKRSAKAIIEERVVHQSPTSYEGRFHYPETLKRKHYEYDEENNIMWVNMRTTMLQVPEEETVYNLNVDNTHSYIANGALVHNCSAYNFQINGTLNKRVTYICVMHQARALANVYYWNKVYLKYKENKVFKNNVPEEWALKIIDKSEWDMLQCLEQEATGTNE